MRLRSLCALLLTLGMLLGPCASALAADRDVSLGALRGGGTSSTGQTDEEEQAGASASEEAGGGKSPVISSGSSYGMTDFERRIVEQGFRLLPYDHPFVIAYEQTYGVDIDSYVAVINGVKVSGVPFEYGGTGNIKDFSSRWWTKTGVSRYPVGGLDCAEYIQWIYTQLGISVPHSSTGLFFAGKTGVTRDLPGLSRHVVLPSLDVAMIGDVAYNSEDQTYRSGHGSHSQLYLGTANKLGIANALLAMYPGFPLDAPLVLDCGWSDGAYYYDLMRALKVPNPRRGMAGVGVQFFTSIKEGDNYLYKSPRKVYKWKNPETGHTFRIESRLEANKRLLQYKPNAKITYPINISRPIVRPDAR